MRETKLQSTGKTDKRHDFNCILNTIYAHTEKINIIHMYCMWFKRLSFQKQRMHCNWRHITIVARSLNYIFSNNYYCFHTILRHSTFTIIRWERQIFLVCGGGGGGSGTNCIAVGLYVIHLFQIHFDRYNFEKFSRLIPAF